MEFGFREAIGLGISGILSVLWFDIRGIRKERQEFATDMEQRYLRKEEHELLCENAALKLERKLEQVKKEIIKEIKNNNRR